jgi:hypothetical protein
VANYTLSVSQTIPGEIQYVLLGTVCAAFGDGMETTMIYQKEFQAEEQPSSAQVSCYCYQSPPGGKFPLHSHSYYEIS